LMDTAGIREGADEVEAIGVERSREKMKSADIVLYLFDAVEESVDTVQQIEKELHAVAKAWIMVGNKVDDDEAAASAALRYRSNEIHFISAKEQLQLDQLKHVLTQKVISGTINTENTVVTSARHYQSLQGVSENIISIQRGMDNNIPGDLLAIDIRQCLYHLGEITGQITNDDQLDFIFSKFCIGK